MGKDFIIHSKNGKVYNGLREYHIALGIKVRHALLSFLDDIEEFCQNKIMEFYSEYTPTDYTRTYQLLSQMNIGGLIKASVKGNWEGKGTISINVFDFSVLESRINEYGQYNTYADFDGTDATGEMERVFGEWYSWS